MVYTEKFGQAGAFITKATSQLMRDLGSIQSPMNTQRSTVMAEFLHDHPKVRFVKYPGLPDDPWYALAQKYLPNGSCGVVSFGFTGGRAAAEQFMKNLHVAQIATHVADARTCVLHPANATHRQMTDEELAAAGIAPDMVRLSCGLEDTEDLIADVAQALETV